MSIRQSLSAMAALASLACTHPPPRAASASPAAPVDTWQEPAGPREPETVRAILPEDATIDGVPCKGHFEFGRFADRSLSFCNTTRQIERDGLVIGVDAYTTFHPNGHVHQTTIATPKVFLLSAGARLACKAEHVSLAIDGSLEQCV